MSETREESQEVLTEMYGSAETYNVHIVRAAVPEPYLFFYTLLIFPAPRPFLHSFSPVLLRTADLTLISN